MTMWVDAGHWFTQARVNKFFQLIVWGWGVWSHCFSQTLVERVVFIFCTYCKTAACLLCLDKLVSSFKRCGLFTCVSAKLRKSLRVPMTFNRNWVFVDVRSTVCRCGKLRENPWFAYIQNGHRNSVKTEKLQLYYYCIIGGINTWKTHNIKLKSAKCNPYT